jgi:hypothetical protein
LKVEPSFLDAQAIWTDELCLRYPTGVGILGEDVAGKEPDLLGILWAVGDCHPEVVEDGLSALGPMKLIDRFPALLLDQLVCTVECSDIPCLKGLALDGASPPD